MEFDKLNDRDEFLQELITGAELEGKYGMPKLQPVHNLELRKLVPFHMVKTVNNPEQCWFHFYEHDYQFERLWKNPAKYLTLLSRFAGGISTDYSIYLDMPRDQQIWNCLRNRAMAYHMQQSGLAVVPNVGWSDEESLEWAFDGIPSNSLLSITTQGCMGHDYIAKWSLLNGLHELVRRKSPEKLIVYGRFPDAWRERFPMPVVVCKTFSQERWGK